MGNKFSFLIFVSLACASVEASDYISKKMPSTSAVKLVNTKKENNYAGMFQLASKEVLVEVVGADGTDLLVQGEISYYEARTTQESMIVSYLTGLGIQKEGANTISKMLFQGVKSSELCIGNRSDCMVSNLTVQFVVDYYNSTIRIFPTSSMFKAQREESQLTPTNNEGLVSQVYGNVSHMDNTQYYVNIENVFGLGVGYVSSNARLNETQNVLEDLSYTYDGPGFTSSIGFMNGDQSLGIASQGRFIDGDYIGFAFSNKDSLKLRNLGGRNVSFFSSFEGDYEVLKEGDVIYRGFARSGENRIAYSQLPEGSYRITIQVKYKDQMLLIGEDYVTNISNYQAGETSYYFRSGLLKDYDHDERDAFFVDSGISIPMTETSSMITNLALIDDSLFLGGGAYANFLGSNVSVATYVSDEQFQATFAFYSGMFNVNGSYDFDDSNDQRAVRESTSLFAGLSHRWGDVNFNMNIGYTNNDDIEYTNYNLGIGYFSPKGWSLHTNVTNPEDEMQVQVMVNLPIGNGLHNSLTAFARDDVAWRNSLNGSYVLSEDLTVNGTMNTNFLANQSSETDVRVGANYSSEHLSSSASISKIGDTKGFSGSISTTAYVTDTGFAFKNSLDDKNTFLEVRSKKGTPLNGRLKLKDPISQSTQTVLLDSDETIEIQDYSRKKLSYEFDSYEYRLVDANMKSGIELDFTPGKVHQLVIDQEPIGNILVIWNPELSEAPKCEGTGCLEQQKINAYVSRFLVMPNVDISIKGGAMICFDGQVEHGRTKKGICKS